MRAGEGDRPCPTTLIDGRRALLQDLRCVCEHHVPKRTRTRSVPGRARTDSRVRNHPAHDPACRLNIDHGARRDARSFGSALAPVWPVNESQARDRPLDPESGGRGRCPCADQWQRPRRQWPRERPRSERLHRRRSVPGRPPAVRLPPRRRPHHRHTVLDRARGAEEDQREARDDGRAPRSHDRGADDARAVAALSDPVGEIPRLDPRRDPKDGARRHRAQARGAADRALRGRADAGDGRPHQPVGRR